MCLINLFNVDVLILRKFEASRIVRYFSIYHTGQKAGYRGHGLGGIQTFSIWRSDLSVKLLPRLLFLFGLGSLLLGDFLSSDFLFGFHLSFFDHTGYLRLISHAR